MSQRAILLAASALLLAGGCARTTHPGDGRTAAPAARDRGVVAHRDAGEGPPPDAGPDAAVDAGPDAAVDATPDLWRDCPRCADGVACTADLCVGDGGCRNPLRRGFCLIGGVCRTAGASRTPSGCDICEPGVWARGWTRTTCVGTVAGSGTRGYRDGRGRAAMFQGASGLAYGEGKLFVTDWLNRRIRMVDVKTGAVSTLAGSGARGDRDDWGTRATFDGPSAVVLSGGILAVADCNNDRVRAVIVPTARVLTFTGSGIAGYLDGKHGVARFRCPYGLALAGGTLFIADWFNHRIRTADVKSGTVSTLAGDGKARRADGTGTSASFDRPNGLTVAGSTLYVADFGNHSIRAVVIGTGAVSTLAGDGKAGWRDGPGGSARFDGPSDLAIHGTLLIVSDYNNNLIRTVDLTTRAVATLAGTGARGHRDGPAISAIFDRPDGLALSGSTLYIADDASIRVIRLRP